MLAARDRINTAEDFIEEAATQSSLSGQPYQIRCGGHDVVTSNQWLRDVLARYRAARSTGRTTPNAWCAWDQHKSGPGPEPQSSFWILMSL